MGGYDETLYKGEKHKQFKEIIFSKIKKELGEEKYNKWIEDEYPELIYRYDYNSDIAYIEPNGEDFNSDEIEFEKEFSKKLNKDIYNALVPKYGDMNSALSLFYHGETSKKIHFQCKDETIIVMDW